MSSRASVTWRYLPGREIKHALYLQDADDWRPPALCGVHPPLREGRDPTSGWFGTGSQAEYELVETLRECERCALLVTEVV